LRIVIASPAKSGVAIHLDCFVTVLSAVPANEHKVVIAKEACRLRQSTEILRMDGHVAALLAMTMVEVHSSYHRTGRRWSRLSR
jgi:hypothetical protein